MTATFPFAQVGIFAKKGIALHLRTWEKMLREQGARVHWLRDGVPETPLDLAIAMGGDGTVLRTLALLLPCPVLGVNYGTVGFLTAAAREDIVRVIQRLAARDYVLSERLILHCELDGKPYKAINELCLRTTSRMLSIDVFVDGGKIRTIRGDGVILGTPTGSTGYLMSTGAPLVMPQVDCLILNGINEYNFTSRPLILPPQASIELFLASPRQKQRVVLSIDGKEKLSLQAGRHLTVRAASSRARLIFFEKDFFFHNLASRLAWI